MHFPLVQTLAISLSILVSLVAAAPTPSPEAAQNTPSWKRDAQDAQVAARSWSAVVPPNKFNRSPDFIVL